MLRYRTGDLVRFNAPKIDENMQFLYLAEGILGRTDQMLIIRGVNILPSAVEQIIHGFSDVCEFRLTAIRSGAMDELKVEVEAEQDLATQIGEQLQINLGLRIDVNSVPTRSLPRFEGKATRFIDLRPRED